MTSPVSKPHIRPKVELWQLVQGEDTSPYQYLVWHVDAMEPYWFRTYDRSRSALAALKRGDVEHTVALARIDA